MPPPRKDVEEEESSEETSSGSESDSSSSPAEPVIARRHKFDDEEDESDAPEAWDEADDSEAEAEKAKKAAEAKAKANAEAAANKKTKAERIEEQRMARMRQKMENEESSEEEDEATKRARLRKREQDSDLKHAEDLFGAAALGPNKDRSKPVVVADPKDPSNTVDLASFPLFNPTTKDQFLKLRETLVPILASNAKKAQYTLFMQEFTKQIVKDLPSDQIKKIASGLTTLSNEKMKEEKAAEKGGKKSKAAKSKVALVANRDASSRADTTSYGDGLDDDDDFM